MEDIRNTINTQRKRYNLGIDFLDNAIDDLHTLKDNEPIARNNVYIDFIEKTLVMLSKTLYLHDEVDLVQQLKQIKEVK